MESYIHPTAAFLTGVMVRWLTARFIAWATKPKTPRVLSPLIQKLLKEIQVGEMRRTNPGDHVWLGKVCVTGPQVFIANDVSGTPGLKLDLPFKDNELVLQAYWSRRFGLIKEQEQADNKKALEVLGV